MNWKKLLHMYAHNTDLFPLFDIESYVAEASIKLIM